MNAGVLTFATRGKTFKRFGTHQKFDREAYRLIRQRLKPGTFPLRAEILNFEGMGGPDGLKFKGDYKADHLWDPINEIGHLPLWIDVHYKNLVIALRLGDRQKAAFEAGFMAHYLTDSLTPAHHLSFKLLMAENEKANKMRKRWQLWGRKGLMSSHVAFESGVSSTVAFSPVRSSFDAKLFEEIRSSGISETVRAESRAIAELDLYNEFLRNGWTVKLAKTTKVVVVKRIPQLIAAAWLSAYVEAGYKVELPA